jgi:uncharacterized delta-60 repeat protein
LPDGALDASFGEGGIVVPIRNHGVGPRLALQSDGKVVLATRGEVAPGSVFVYRFSADGAPDSSFGTSGDGTAELFPLSGMAVSSIAGVGIGAGGKVVVAVRVSPVGGGAAVGFARFNSDGTPDATFGSGGFASVELEHLLLPIAFELQPDGRMLVGGFAVLPDRFFTDAVVARFAADGSLDPGFGSGGIAALQRPANGTEFQTLALAADGAVVAGGRQFGSVFGENQWLFARFTPQGVLDPSFGAAGAMLYDPGSGDDVVLDLALTPDGTYATGVTQMSLGLPVALFDDVGNLVSAFGTGGVAGLSGQFTRGAWRLGVQADGKVVVFGTIQTFVPTFNQDLYLARYAGATPPDADEDGVLDEIDVCLGTAIPESAPTNHLGVNRWALVDDDGVFDTTPPPGGGGGPNFEFTVEDTRGCSCEQIIEAWALGWGHTKFGCSTGVILQWMATVWNYEMAQPVTESQSITRGFKMLDGSVDDSSASGTNSTSDSEAQRPPLRPRRQAPRRNGPSD